MGYKLLLTYFFISSQLLHSQTEKVKGTVMCNDFTLQGIEVVNLVSKNIVITNNSGVFSILAKVGDEIIFISKNYEYKTITFKEADFQNTNLVIKLIKKTEELDEVVITNKIIAPLIPNMQELLDTQVPDDAYSQKKNPFGTDGSITYGPDIIKIFGRMAKLFTKQKENKAKEIIKMDFKELAKNNISQEFFSKYLKLNPDEIHLFLEFCDADSKSKKLIENSNELELMDFLFAKNSEFKKLNKD
ncbi:hypothetical protein SAMN05443549_101600 [Flavobacterium fluvii]|uniref:CarboxypepD_reg-like domain-containing protein n=1 Tax=Flavobacterium fluvii TaxID=468056 RepID=A0A1M5F3E5_9FLAO|nr:hypothetical protein [Flavobacterium fluvii]SHF85898.1 hypothetical protein SAMN05443549_101600 [Flavobacterium fluvii]